MSEPTDQINSMRSEINKLKSEINKLKSEINKLNKKVETNEKINNAQNLDDFKIKTADEWNRIESSINKTGLFFEFEIFKLLDSLNLDFFSIEFNNTFEYPSQKNCYYIDYYFSEHKQPDISPKNSMEVSEFESDIVLWDRDSVIIDNLEFNYNNYYIIECKSRFNPPINYFIIPINFQGYLDIDNFVSFKSTIFPNVFSIPLENYKMTDKKITKISYPDMKIDDQDNIKKFFYQIFNGVDHKCNDDLFWNHYFSFKKIEMDIEELPKNIEIPPLFRDFNQYYTQMKDQELVPEFCSRTFSDLFQYHVPIIVLNGNIYSMDLEQRSLDFKEKCNEIPGFFLKYEDKDKTDAPNRSYINLMILFMDLLNQYNIINLNENFQKLLMNSVSLEMIFTTKDTFQATFLEIKRKFKEKFKENLTELLENNPLFLENLIRFQVFIWILNQNYEWRKQLFSELHKRYLNLRNLDEDIL